MYCQGVHFQSDVFLSGNPNHTYLGVLKAVRKVVWHLVFTPAIFFFHLKVIFLYTKCWSQNEHNTVSGSLSLWVLFFKTGFTTQFIKETYQSHTLKKNYMEIYRTSQKQKQIIQSSTQQEMPFCYKTFRTPDLKIRSTIRAFSVTKPNE